jgi:hypothetical protein
VGQSIEQAREMAQTFFDSYSASLCVITMARDGVVYTNHSGTYHLPAHDVKVANTAGAGDTFSAGPVNKAVLSRDKEYGGIPTVSGSGKAVCRISRQDFTTRHNGPHTEKNVCTISSQVRSSKVSGTRCCFYTGEAAANQVLHPTALSAASSTAPRAAEAQFGDGPTPHPRSG